MSTTATALTRTMAIRSIVAPYDFSPRCRAAARHALALSRHFGAQLVFTHVIPFSSFEYAAFEGGAYVGSAWPSEAEARDKLDSELAALDATAEERTAWRVLVSKGDPPENIERLVAEQDSPLVVMPTHGYGAFRRFVLGSVTTKVLHDLECPVLTGAHIGEGEAFPTEGYRRVACAAELGEESRSTVEWASEFARSWKAEFVVLHAIDWLEHSPADMEFFTPELRERLLDSARRKAADMLADAGFPEATLQIGLGPAANYVPRAIRDCGADLLVVGRSAAHGPFGRMKARAYDLIRSAPCPVVSV